MLSLISKLFSTALTIIITLIGSHIITWRGKTLSYYAGTLVQQTSSIQIPEPIRALKRDLTEAELSPEDKKELFGLISNSSNRGRK